MAEEAGNRQLVVGIVDFLRGELDSRDDLTHEDRDSLGIAIECLEIAYGLESQNPRERSIRRPLLDMFNQVIHPPTVKDRLQAERLKTEGNEKMDQHHYEEALETYTQAIELDRWNAIYYCNRAGANIALNQYYDAIEDCREALALNPDYAKAFARMGQAYAMIERPRQALRCFQQAAQLEPDNERYRNNLRVAENRANAAPPRADAFQNMLNSIFGSSNQLPSGNTLTIISQMAPTDSDTSSGETHLTNETVHSDLSSENQIESETQPNETETQNVWQFALPIVLGLLGHLSGHPNDENETIEMLIQPSQETEPVSFHFRCPSTVETNENNADLQETLDLDFNNAILQETLDLDLNNDIRQETLDLDFHNLGGFGAFIQSITRNENSLHPTENRIDNTHTSGFSFRQSEPTEPYNLNRLENTETDLEERRNEIRSDSAEIRNSNESSPTNLEEQAHSGTTTERNNMESEISTEK